MDIKLHQNCASALNELYGAKTTADKITINETPKEYNGDYTFVTYPFLSVSRKSPEQTGQEIGTYLQNNVPGIIGFNVIKGFLNIALDPQYWISAFNQLLNDEQFGQAPATGKKIVLEYIGPNTNKPLHLGHIRNMLIGHSVAAILSANGHEVHLVNIYNDKGINISKSMAAWVTAGTNETPESSGKKGDHLVGEYYVLYNKIAVEQAAPFIEKGMDKREAEKQTAIYKLTEQFNRDWEKGKPEVIELWKTMNGWVYEGFKETYQRLGVGYEKAYYESECYQLGKNLVLEGLNRGVFFNQPDGSVWVDLQNENLDQKVLIRNDGTSVYITQDMGVADQRFHDYHPDQMIYVVGDEQIYHFKVLKLTLKKLGMSYSDKIHHLYYGMVDLPEGKMKSREGKVVDADDLIDEMIQTAEEHTVELGKTEGMSESEAKELYEILGLGALKYFMLRVNAQKRLLFNPKESIDFQGHTGPFVQYTHARICSILRKFNAGHLQQKYPVSELLYQEKNLIQELSKFPATINSAAEALDPSIIAGYAFTLAKTYNKLYAELSILNNESHETNIFRVALSASTARILKQSLNLLGIKAPERM
ncbi:MAG: arginine--tRNA ligase [Sphingobacteriales bacterium]|nr:MAG: arginine--tRNA ligase [Sphingobacteriales bacterium]